MKRSLAQLLGGVPICRIVGTDRVLVTGLVHDHRRVRPGAAFVAVPGSRFDGHQFLGPAVERGARVLVVQRMPQPIPPKTTVVQVADTRAALPYLAANWFGHPARSLYLVGVTGTNGKTSVTYLLQSLLEEQGLPCGRLGTIGYAIGEEIFPASTTTPDPLELHRLLRRAVDRGLRAVAMEVSSHALCQHRVDGLEFHAAVWTNLTQDHLDFHGSMEAYRAAKLRLLEAVRPDGVVALNRDDPAYPHFRRAALSAGARIVPYGRHREAVVRATDVRLSPTGTRFTLVWDGRPLPVRLRMLGTFSVWNALAAAAVGFGNGWDPERVVAAIEAVVGVPGRFEPIDLGQPFGVVVDYAHTPDALENLLRGARSLSPARVVCVFGCGGDRDRGKRPKMGRIAVQLADRVVLTSDNPRSEDPLQILREIEAGIPPGADYVVVPDRAEAIRTAIQEARPGDLVLIAGKGHEDYQIVGERRLPFDDRAVARQILQERWGDALATRGEDARAVDAKTDSCADRR